MNAILNQIGERGLVPVVVIDNAEMAVDAARALMDGGLDVMEITLRTDAGITAIEKVRKAYPDMLVGAGTVLAVDKAREAVEAGARFIVTPGLNPKVVEWCLEKGIAITPGCVTPTEIEQALSYGLDMLKFFPANLYGGVEGCKALHGPYRHVGFIPTGGVTRETLGEYADKPYVHAIGGGWLCKPADINAGRFDAITRIVRASIDTLLGFEFVHMGINADHGDEASAITGMFAKAFGFPVSEGETYRFAGPGVEVMKSPGKGAMGHIGIQTNSIYRAVHYLGKRGFAVDPDTYKAKNGKPFVVYMKDDFGGYAVHLMQK